jgi:hypothetical protein
MPELWVPGYAGPADDLVERIHRRIEQFPVRQESSRRPSRSSSLTAPGMRSSR